MAPLTAKERVHQLSKEGFSGRTIAAILGTDEEHVDLLADVAATVDELPDLPGQLALGAPHVVPDFAANEWATPESPGPVFVTIPCAMLTDGLVIKAAYLQLSATGTEEGAVYVDYVNVGAEGEAVLSALLTLQGFIPPGYSYRMVANGATALGIAIESPIGV